MWGPGILVWDSSDRDDTEAVSQSESAAVGRKLLKGAFCFCLSSCGCLARICCCCWLRSSKGDSFSTERAAVTGPDSTLASYAELGEDEGDPREPEEPRYSR